MPSKTLSSVARGRTHYLRCYERNYTPIDEFFHNKGGKFIFRVHAGRVGNISKNSLESCVSRHVLREMLSALSDSLGSRQSVANQPQRLTQPYSARGARPAKYGDAKCAPWPTVCAPLRTRTESLAPLCAWS